MQLKDLQTSGIIRNKVTMELLGLWQVVTEIKFTLQMSLFCKLTDRCNKLRFDKVRIRSHSIKWTQTWKHPCALASAFQCRPIQ